MLGSMLEVLALEAEVLDRLLAKPGPMAIGPVLVLPGPLGPISPPGVSETHLPGVRGPASAMKEMSSFLRSSSLSSSS